MIAYVALLFFSHGIFSSSALRVNMVKPVEDEFSFASAENYYYQDAAENHFAPIMKLEVDCAEGKRVFSSAMVMIKDKGLWCPTAKAGTTSMYLELAQVLHMKELKTPTNRCLDGRCFSDSLKSPVKMIANGMGKNLCGTFSYIVIRNPWERLLSAYKAKVATKILEVPGYKKSDKVTFAQFIRAVTKQDPTTLNIHWRPVSSRCLTNDFKYDEVHRIEDGDFNAKLDELMTKSGVEIAHPYHWHKGVSDDEKQQKLKQRIDMYTSDPSLSNPNELVDLVGTFYASDVKQGGYSFDKYA